MHIDELILKLQEIKEEYGNIPVHAAKGHDYWGTVYNKIDDITLRVDNNVSDNPKKVVENRSVVFCAGYDC